MNLRYSILMLPSSLSKLCKAFYVKSPKDIFPHDFVSLDTLNYNGEVPAYEFFDQTKVSLLDYKEYASRFNHETWCLKSENIKYCELDCTSLYQVLNKFKTFIDEQFEVNILDCPTITSLAFKFFKANFYNPDKNPIAQLIKKLSQQFEPWFFGGHCDTYIPSGPKDNGSYTEVINKLNNLTDKSIDNVKKRISYN